MVAAMIFFAVGVLGTSLVGALGRIGSAYFLEKKVTPISGFSIAIGFVLAGGFRGVETNTDLEQAMLNIGMLLGLVVLWFWYFRRGNPVI